MGNGYRASRKADGRGELTPAVGEAPVAGGTAGALAADDVGPAGTLSPPGLALAAPRPGLVAAARLRPVVVEEGQRDGRVTAEAGGCAGAAGQGGRNQCCTSPQPPHHPKPSTSCCGRESPVTLRAPKYPRLVNRRKTSTSPSLAHMKGRGEAP